MEALSVLEEFDRDGAIEETSEAVRESVASRSGFLRKAGLGAGALVGASAFAGSMPRVASGATPKSDVAILNYALTLEYLEAAFYTEAVARGRFKGELGRFARIVKAHEIAHVKFLEKALGTAAISKPKFDFKGTTTSKAQFKATAQVLEDTGVAAYLGQVGLIKSKAILAAAGSILPIEARHAGWIRSINGVSGAPKAFEGARTKAQILAAVGGTGFIVG